MSNLIIEKLLAKEYPAWKATKGKPPERGS